ncbi:metalloregulator ArsR/SmtB family transcription factor [Dehalobacter sp. DCM]|uniref:ArsR/SmtB family transcription factor n=1 Tax=Dehalobacter sp. DCM TaxID=2907827 RepID=UPI0030820EAA|nr:metalloregulator ArsR/SmtB family transcription factor [Dehalobacter sp. DCM]
MKNIEDILKALADETRLRIINLLYEKELCVCDIHEALNITQTKASRHLQYLKHAELVGDRKHAQWIYYSIKKDESLSFIDNLILNNMRNSEQFQKDLENLKEWLKRKSIDCD